MMVCVWDCVWDCMGGGLRWVGESLGWVGRVGRVGRGCGACGVELS